MCRTTPQPDTNQLRKEDGGFRITLIRAKASGSKPSQNYSLIVIDSNLLIG